MKRRSFLKVMALPFALPTTNALAQSAAGRSIRMIVPLRRVAGIQPEAVMGRVWKSR
jgi:hypothetical protein